MMRRGLYPLVSIAAIKPFIRKPVPVYKGRVFSPGHELLIGFMYFYKSGGITALIRMVPFCLAPECLFDDLIQLGIIELRSAQFQMKNGLSNQRRFFYFQRFNGLQLPVVSAGLVE